MRIDEKSPEFREIELKLEVDSGDVDRLRAYPFFAAADAAVRNLTSIYFDTGKHTLRENGITLRVRHDGRGYTQTIKAERAASGLALNRGEWEHPLASAAPDFQQAIGTPLEPLIASEKSRQKLRPVFTVYSERVTSTVSNSGSLIELALDTARIEADCRQVAFAEIELELKKGDPKDLFATALNLADTAPLRLSRRSKSDRGYALFQKNPPMAARAEPILLEGDWSISRAFQVICNSCLRQLIKNEVLLREAPSPDAVHQARVAIRRLRAAISLFKDVVTDKQIDGIKSELKWIADKLGKARDLDVFIAKSLEPGAKDGDEQAVQLLAVYRRQRDEAYALAIKATRSQRFSRGVLTTAAWIETGPWLAGDTESGFELFRQPIDPFARGEFDRRWRKTRSRLKSIDRVDEEMRHRARIDIKKLRYAAEFFFTLLRGRASDKRFQNTLKMIERLQGTLGDLNDIAVARSLFDSATEPSVQKSQESKVPELLTQAKRQASKFRAVEPFWTADLED